MASGVSTGQIGGRSKLNVKCPIATVELRNVVGLATFEAVSALAGTLIAAS